MKKFLKSFISINPTSLTLLATLCVVVLFIVGVPIFDMIELKTYDLRFMSRGSLKPSPAIVLAVIDEKSLDKEGRWPWPRSKIAKLVDILSQDGAKVIGFDIGFLEPDENSQLQIINEFGQKIDNLGAKNDKLSEFLNESRLKADNDLILANAIRRSTAKVVLGYFFHTSAAGLNYEIDQEEIGQRLQRLSPSKYPLIIYEDQNMERSPFLKAYAPESNIPILAEAAEFSGYFNMVTDTDGVVRWMPLIIGCGEDVFPPLSVQCVWHYLDRPQVLIEVASHGVEGVQMGKWFVPTDESGRMLINYLGPAKTFPHYPITDILNGNLPKGIFKDKIVLVGGTAVGIHDLRNTPFSPIYPGLEVHATITDNILTHNILNKPHWARIYDLIAILLLGFIAGMVLPRVGAIKGVLFVSGLFVLHIVISHWLFVNSRVWLNIVYPLMVLVITYTALTLYHYMTEERERKKVKGAFRHYVSHDVIEDMLKEPGRLKLGGEEKVITVLFSDLAGFTGYSERYAPHEMINILSDYFEKMTEQIFAHQGTLKEYVGDELMAIFGAPLEQTDHAKRACTTALAMRDQLRALRRDWADIGRPALRARTGINSGPMLVGNLGSRFRFSYGALGDQVNLGSRLEGLNKAYGTEILIGENTAKLVEGAFVLREVDMVRVKGREQPVRIYELLAKSEASLSEERAKALGLYVAALEAYRQQRWKEALDQFQQVLVLWPEDQACRVMAQRCRIYQQSPPQEGWDGVFEHLTK